MQRAVVLVGLLTSTTPAAPLPAAGAVAAASPTPTPVLDLNLPMKILLNGTLPRYVVGEVVVGGRLQHVTFDTGNPRATILTSEGCLGCSSGCPSTVPSCAQTGSNFCSPSHPQEYVPLSAYTVNASESCAPGTQNVGILDNLPVCQQCFDGGNHARFYHLARSDVSVVSSSGPVTFRHMPFGALVRATPLQDRIWGNIGLGHSSDFVRKRLPTDGWTTRHNPLTQPRWLVSNSAADESDWQHNARTSLASSATAVQHHAEPLTLIVHELAFSIFHSQLKPRFCNVGAVRL